MSLEDRLKHNKNKGQKEVSVAVTLIRTAILIGLTLAFMAIFRFWKPAIHGMQKVAGTGAWQSLYGFFHINSGLGREQLILTAVMLVCFALALLAQFIGLWLIRIFCKRT